MLAMTAVTGCTQRTAPVVSFAPKAQLGKFDAVIVARGMS